MARSIPPEDDIARLDTLGRILGIGLMLFHVNDPQQPALELRVRAAKNEPDMLYVNRCLRVIEDPRATVYVLDETGPQTASKGGRTRNVRDGWSRGAFPPGEADLPDQRTEHQAAAHQQ